MQFGLVFLSNCINSVKKNWIWISKNTVSLYLVPTRQILTVQYFKLLIVHSFFLELLKSKLLKMRICQFARRSLIIFLNRSFTVEMKVRSRAKSGIEQFERAVRPPLVFALSSVSSLFYGTPILCPIERLNKTRQKAPHLIHDT